MIAETEAIVLNSRKYSESSKILTVFSKEFGLVKLIAKGARKTKNKFGGALDPLSYSSIQFYKKPGKDLHLLGSAETFRPLRQIHYSIDHLCAGLIILESVAQSQNIHEKNEELFSLLAKTLILLNGQKERPFSLFVAFQLKLAENLGFGLNFDGFDEIVQFYKDNNQNIPFSLENGAIETRDAGGYNHIFRIQPEVMKNLALVAGLPIEKADEAEFVHKKIITGFFSSYFSFHLDKRFSYRSFDLLNI